MFWGRRRPLLNLLGWPLAALAAGACNTRERITFREPGTPGGEGPTTVITRPGADTTVSAGPSVVVQGTARDPQGVDTFYAQVAGGITTFPPFPGNDSLFIFDLPITTTGQAGEVITVRLFATDEDGNRGDTATRVITVQ